jgi:chromosome segregation ATPase
MNHKALSISRIFFFMAMFGVVSAPIVPATDAWAKRGSLSLSQRLDFYKQKVKYRSEKSAAKTNIRALTKNLPDTERALKFAKNQLLNSARNLDTLQRQYDAQLKVATDIAARDGVPVVVSSALRRQEAALTKAKAYHENGPVKIAKASQDASDLLTNRLTNERANLNAARNSMATRKANKDAARAVNLTAAEARKAARRAAKGGNNQQVGAIAQTVFPPIPAGVVPVGTGNNNYVALPIFAQNPNLPPPPAPAGIYGAQGGVFSQLP